MNADLPTFESFPGDIYFRHQPLNPATWDAHAHDWGQLNYLSQGVMELEIEGARFLSPPHYGVWIPPRRAHASRTAASGVYRSIYLSETFSERLPGYSCCLAISPLLKALLEAFALLDVRTPTTQAELNMAQVVLDQLEIAAPVETYLPYAASDKLNMLLNDVLSGIGRKLTVERIAQTHNMTLRTLERRCRSELGMSFGEWRQRARFLQAVEALDSGETVQSLSYRLGYATPSAFIHMFKRVAGVTPTQYRR